MITQDDVAQLRNYVMAPSDAQNQAESTVRLQVSHSNLKARFLEVRLDKHVSREASVCHLQEIKAEMTIAAVKHKLMSHTGSSPSAMQLHLQDEHGQPLAHMSEDSRLLGYYSPCDGCILRVVDLDPNSVSAQGWLEDTSRVQKYVMSDEAYGQRDNTYRKYKMEKLKEDPEWTAEKELCQRRGLPYKAPKAAVQADEEHQAQAAAAIHPGQRCEVDPGGKRGVVRYVGKCAALPAGWWIGVEYDEPVGKNDGSAKGKRYFHCLPGHGAFLRPEATKVGDFPPLDIFGSDDEI